MGLMDDVIADSSLTFSFGEVSMQQIEGAVAAMDVDDEAQLAAVFGLQDVADEAERRQRVIASIGTVLAFIRTGVMA